MNKDFFAALQAGWSAFRAVLRPPAAKEEEASSESVQASAVEQRYRSLFESATDLILTHDLEGTITSFNPAGERLLGWSEKEIIGRNISELLAREERDTTGGITAPSSPLRIENGVSFQLDLLTRDGRRVPVEISSWMETRDGRPVGRQAICRDLSERRAAEAERARLDHKLQESQKLESLGVLAGGVAHDFNNLLTSILGHASLARMDVSSGSPTGACLQQIEIAAERAASLCQQMLAYSGQGRFVIKRTDLSKVVSDSEELLRASVSRKITLELRLADAVPAVMADVSQLRQLLLSLVINAGEAIGDQPGVITIATSVRQASRLELAQAHLSPDLPEGEYIALEITDTGTGLDEAIRGRIFDPFFSTKFTGRGLGLAAALGIVRGHRGAIYVSSTVGEGTAFRVLLPSTGAPSLQAEFPFSTAAHSAGLVLVVDDEESIRTTTRRMLENSGYEVITAVDGLDAVARVRQHGARIRAVLLDLTMPRMDGVEAFREMLQLQPHLRVILMSGFSEQHAIARFAGQGLSGYMQKPLTTASLRAKLGSLLAEPVEV